MSSLIVSYSDSLDVFLKIINNMYVFFKGDKLN